ncbi:hypothetical protein HYY69_08630 [Candidatus Woesearchaeota archaeon]|nr:hypothetical protein [Candidatus Woesearchaeota archaeon]
MSRSNNYLVEIALEDRIFEESEQKLGTSGFLPNYLALIKEFVPEDASLIDMLAASRTISGAGFKLHHLIEARELRFWYTDQGIKQKDIANIDPRTLGLELSDLMKFCGYGLLFELELYARVGKKGIGVDIPPAAFSLVHPAIEKKARDAEDAEEVMAGYYFAGCKALKRFCADERATTVFYDDLKAAVEFFERGGDSYRDRDATLKRAVRHIAQSPQVVLQQDVAIYTGR